MTRILASLCAFLLIAPAALAADDKPAPRTIVVSATGTVEVVPDMAEIRTGVTTRADSARQAVDANNAAMARLMRVLDAARNAARDIRTSNFSVNPEYKHVRGEQPRVIGYRAANTVHVRIRDIDNVGKILDQVVTAGSNTIQGIGFTVSKPDALTDQARRKAVALAVSRAKLLANAAGAELGPVLQISEGAVRVPQPRMLAARAVAQDSVVPVSRGSQTLSATVTMRFALK